jgi:YVTN family beta-propeller protein
MILVIEGDAVRIILKNELPEATSIHWHGIPVPNAMDGVTPIQPGESFAYEFTAPPAGSFMYHSHVNSDKQLGLGLYAPFIVDPKTSTANQPAVDVSWMLSEWRVGADGQTYAAMPMAGAEPNYFTINGKSYPNTPPIEVKKGQRVRVRLSNAGQLTHPMHLHGMNFKIVAYDGVPLPPEQQTVRNTVPVNPGELVDIELVAENVGTWMFHCHVLHHVTNDNEEPGGLVALVNVTDPAAAQGIGVQGSIWVANEDGDSISVINAATNQIITTLTGIPGPHNLQVAADGKSVWAVSGHAALALAIDPATYTLRGTVPTGRDPAHIILAPNGKTAYVTNSGDNTVTVIDTAALTVTATIPVGEFPHGLRPSPDGKWMYVANVNDNTLSVIDSATSRKVTDIEVGEKPVQAGFAPDGEFVYVSLNGENAVGKVDVGTRKLVGKVQVGVGPIQVYVTPDGKYLLAANQGTKDKPSTTVSIVDTATFAAVDTVPPGQGAYLISVERWRNVNLYVHVQ